MERAISAFIWLAVAAGFGYGLFFTEGRYVPALGGAAIFGAAAIVVAGLGAVLAEVASRLLRRARRKASRSGRP